MTLKNCTKKCSKNDVWHHVPHRDDSRNASDFVVIAAFFDYWQNSLFRMVECNNYQNTICFAWMGRVLLPVSAWYRLCGIWHYQYWVHASIIRGLSEKRWGMARVRHFHVGYRFHPTNVGWSLGLTWKFRSIGSSGYDDEEMVGGADLIIRVYIRILSSHLQNWSDYWASFPVAGPHHGSVCMWRSMYM